MSFDNTRWDQTRRHFLTSSASGLGAAALASLLQQDGLLGDELSADPLAPKPAPLPAKAKQCIFILPAGAPSHLDLFDPKPKLRELHGEKPPASLLENVRFDARETSPQAEERGSLASEWARWGDAFVIDVFGVVHREQASVTDIAGLIKGAADGEGLGNAFLSHIQAVDGIFHVVRAFDDPNVVHVEA